MALGEQSALLDRAAAAMQTAVVMKMSADAAENVVAVQQASRDMVGRLAAEVAAAEIAAAELAAGSDEALDRVAAALQRAALHKMSADVADEVVAEQLESRELVGRLAAEAAADKRVSFSTAQAETVPPVPLPSSSIVEIPPFRPRPMQ